MSKGVSFLYKLAYSSLASDCPRWRQGRGDRSYLLKRAILCRMGTVLRSEHHSSWKLGMGALTWSKRLWVWLQQNPMPSAPCLSWLLRSTCCSHYVYFMQAQLLPNSGRSQFLAIYKRRISEVITTFLVQLVPS